MKKHLSFFLTLVLVLSSVSFAAPTAISTVDSSEEATSAVESAIVETAEVSAESDLGTLVAKVDFENAQVDTVIEAGKQILISEIGTLNLPEGFPKLYYQTTGRLASDPKGPSGYTTIAANTDGSKYGVVTFDAAGWPKIGLFAESNVFMPAGKYTIKMDTKVVSGAFKMPPSLVVTPNDPNGNWTIGEYNITTHPVSAADSDNEGYTKLSTTFSYYEGQIITTQTNGINHPSVPFKGFGKFAFYPDSSSVTCELQIDNLELYYKAPDVTIKIADGKDSVINCNVGDTVDLSTYSVADKATAKFTGWKVENTDTIINSYVPTSAGVVKIVPSFTYYAPGLGFDGSEFDTYEEFRNSVTTSFTPESPSGLNPSISGRVNKEAGTVSFDMKFDSTTTFPASTKLNTHFNMQVTGKTPINTDLITGVEYRYRLIAPEGAENPTSYFTGNSNFNTKVYFKIDWPKEFESLPGWTGKCSGGDGWHWGECVGWTKTAVAKGTSYNGEWITMSYDLDSFVNTTHGISNYALWKEATKCSDFRIQFVSDTKIMGDFTIEVDYVRFLLKDGITNEYPTLVDCDFYDLRKGYVDVTFSEKIANVNPAELTSLISAPFNTACELIENEDGTATYRFFASSSVRNKTVTFKEYAFTSNCVVYLPEALTKLSHTYTSAEVTAKADGENLVPNGDFSNPYYIPFAAGSFDLKLVDGALQITHKEVMSEWNSLVINDIKFKPNTHYYISYDADFTQESENPHAKQTEPYETLTLYFPVADGALALGNAYGFENNGRLGSVSYIPSTNTKDAQLKFNGLTFGKDNDPFARVIQIMDESYYSDTSKMTFSHGTWNTYKDNFFEQPNITFQTCITNGIKAGLYTRGSETSGTADYKKIYGSEGLQYTLENFTVKEMFPITFVDDDNTTVFGTYYAAKDVPITLPAATLYKPASGKAIIGWTDGTNIYDTSSSFTLKAAGALTLTAVTANAPITQKTLSVRTDAYTGVRFKAAVSLALKEKAETTEYGFIVTRKALLGSVSERDFTMDGDVKYIKGQAYIKGSVDKVFDFDDTFNYFSVVVYNLPTEQYDDILVIRPYLVHDGVTSYGEPISSSMRNAAQAVKDSAGFASMSDEEKSKIEAILNA